MGTLRDLQLDADNAAPIKEDVASTARVQAITQSLRLVLLIAAADMTRLGCRYESWRPSAAYVSYALRRASMFTSVVDVLERKKIAPKSPGVLRATPMSPLEVPTACVRRGAKDLVIWRRALSRRQRL